MLSYIQHMFPRRFKRRETQTRTHTLDLVFQGRPTAAEAARFPSSRFRPKKVTGMKKENLKFPFAAGLKILEKQKYDLPFPAQVNFLAGQSSFKKHARSYDEWNWLRSPYATKILALHHLSLNLRKGS